nr:nucleotidyl transferase AbiEii/AbiGii toxin family protein [Phyllobacterium sp. KW56]
MRPEIKIEIAVFPVCTALEKLSVLSFVAEASRADAEAKDVACVRLAETAADKFVALGRRAGFAFSGLGDLDHTLVRHVYDLSRIDGHYDAAEAAAIALETMKADVESHGDEYPAYKADPRGETLRAYEIMSKDEKFAEGYAQLLGAMVYGDRPEFAAAFAKVQNFVQRIRDA